MKHNNTETTLSNIQNNVIGVSGTCQNYKHKINMIDTNIKSFKIKDVIKIKINMKDSLVEYFVNNKLIANSKEIDKIDKNRQLTIGIYCFYNCRIEIMS
jgi:hypothetical protein